MGVAMTIKISRLTILATITGDVKSLPD